jgi:hypothetical protein
MVSRPAMGNTTEPLPIVIIMLGRRPTGRPPGGAARETT